MGIYIGHDKEKCKERNWMDKLVNIERTLDRWSKRNLTLFGKITVLKSLVMSSLIHNFSLLETPDDIVKKLEKIMYDFVWDKKDRIKRNTVISSVEDGGISMIDVKSKVSSIKAGWIKRLKENSKWSRILQWYLEANALDIDYMLKMNVKKESDCIIFDKIPTFYREVFLSFNACKTNKEMHLLNDSEYLSSPIMGNDLIRNKGKSIFLVNWLKSNIKYVKDLYDEAGNFISEVQLLNRLHNKSNWIVEYAIVKRAVKKYSEMFKTEMAHFVNIKNVSHLVYNNRFHDIMTFKSRDYYNIMIEKRKKRSHMESVWSREFHILKHKDIWSSIYNRKVKQFPVRKIAEFNYKILQNILYTGYKINKWNKKVSAYCYCGELETPKHLLFECNKIKCIWNILSGLLKTNVTLKNIVIGCDEYNSTARFINVCISIISYIIYCTWVKCSYTGGIYEHVNIQIIVRDRLIFYGKILENTSMYNDIGKRILQTIEHID